MKKKMLALRGSGSVGKSTALFFLYKLLIADPEVKTVSYRAIGQLHDFIAVIKLGGQRVGIVNRGDIPSELKKYLRELEAKGCTLIICAARTRGPVEKVLSDFGTRFELAFVKKRSVSSGFWSIANRSAGLDLASRVYAAIIS